MTLLEELKERRTAASAEMDRIEEEGRELDRQWKAQERLFGELDTAIRALDPTDPPTAEELFGDDTDEQPEPEAEPEDPGLREVRAYPSGRLDGYQQAIASLERGDPEPETIACTEGAGEEAAPERLRFRVDTMARTAFGGATAIMKRWQKLKNTLAACPTTPPFSLPR